MNKLDELHKQIQALIKDRREHYQAREDELFALQEQYKALQEQYRVTAIMDLFGTTEIPLTDYLRGELERHTNGTVWYAARLWLSRQDALIIHHVEGETVHFEHDFEAPIGDVKAALYEKSDNPTVMQIRATYQQELEKTARFIKACERWSRMADKNYYELQAKIVQDIEAAMKESGHE